MTISKCDLCKKIIRNTPITAGFGLFPRVELCHKCGAPVLAFLRKIKVIEIPKLTKKKK